MEVKLAETGPIEGTNNRPVYLDMQVCALLTSNTKVQQCWP